jgi:hypothetical protein
MVWGEGDPLDTYLQTVDWWQGANNTEAFFIKGMGDICTGHPSGAALLTRAEEEGDLQVSYVLAILKYYKYDVTEDVFNHIRCMNGEFTSGSHVRGWRTMPMRRTMDMLPICTSESQQR